MRATQKFKGETLRALVTITDAVTGDPVTPGSVVGKATRPDATVVDATTTVTADAHVYEVKILGSIVGAWELWAKVDATVIRIDKAKFDVLASPY